MKNSTLLTVLGKQCSLDPLGPTFDAAHRSNTHLSFIVVAPIARYPVHRLGIPPYGAVYIPDDWQDVVNAVNAGLQDKMDEVEALLKKQGVSGDVKIVSCEPPLIADAVADRAKLCDLAQISPSLREEIPVFKNALHGLLFQSPVATVLNDMKHDKPKHIFVAWNTSLPAARAVQRALPKLKAATQVTIASFDPVMIAGRDGENPGSDCAKWLSHHGCNVTVQQYPSGGQEIGDAILARASDVGADLIVAGAYGTSKLRQAIFGGTSQTLVDQTEMPVFLAH